MKNPLAMSAVAVVAAAALASAQPPTGGAGQPQTQPRPTAQSEQSATVTLVGCLYREADVPGRQPNIAERAGILEDYILADARPATPGAASPGTPGATGTTGMQPRHTMYKVEQIPDERLRQLVGKRVEVTGRIDAEAGDTKPAGTAGTEPREDRSIGPDAIELPEFEATAIREVPGTCPPKPSAPGMKPGPAEAHAGTPQTQTSTAHTQTTTQPRPEERPAPVTTAPSYPATPQAERQTQARAETQQGQTVTLIGCLYREEDVPGRKPNIAERAGILEDYILAEIRPESQTAPSPGATPGATGTAGTLTQHRMFKVEHIDDNQLKALVGKRVEVTGRIDEDDDTKPTGTAGEPREDRSVLSPDDIELPEFEATSIREVAGTCPATPTRRQQ